MKKVFLGSTGMEVSQIGLGTVKFGRNQDVKYPKEFIIPNDAEVSALISCARDLGINLLDTAPAYGNSEERLGKLLQGQRHEWVLCTKAGENFIDGKSFYDFSRDAIRASVENSLKKLKTDFLDIVLIHSNGDDQKIIEKDRALETLAELKKQGLIRAFGMSTKTVDGGLLAVDQSDVVMVTYNLFERNELPVIQHAKKQKKGVFIKKAFASGHVQSPAEALQFVLSEPGVSSVIVGTINAAHLKELPVIASASARSNPGCI
jgi:aryl-alcohol dehydrogenase-like predicted oxidoreductase